MTGGRAGHVGAAVGRAARSLRDLLRPPLRLAAPSGARHAALLCYTTHPFRRRGPAGHPAQNEAPVIAEALGELGYACSVIDYRSGFPVDYGAYDLLFGFGDVFERSFDAPFAGIRIHYATGASLAVQNRAEMQRLAGLRERHGKLLAPRRVTDRVWAASQALSDAVLCVGNAWTCDTYRPFNPRVIRVPTTHIGHWHPDALGGDPERRRTGFVWFGSGGAVHKGLDLVLDALPLARPSVRLHVCGPVAREDDFMALYGDRLRRGDGVTLHGVVDVRGETMKSILEDCGFVILPSCSEGGGSSVLTCMYSGLVPVVTREASVDIGDFGVGIAEATPAGVAKAVEAAADFSADELARRGRAAHRQAAEVHSLECFRRNLRAALAEVVSRG